MESTESSSLTGPPGAGKTTLLLALAGKLDKDLKIAGKITYNGHIMDEFVPQRTSAYISQDDLHIGEMTVRETLAFSTRCQGVGTRYEMLTELSRREKAANIKPDPDIDLYMKLKSIVEDNVTETKSFSVTPISRPLEDLSLDENRKAMVARGDLGVELPVEEVLLLQEEIIRMCRSMGKAVIVVMDVLESMIVLPTPTRAEVSDMAIVVREGADAVMLSGETAHGKFPLKAVKVMNIVALRAKATMVGGEKPANLGRAFKI